MKTLLHWNEAGNAALTTMIAESDDGSAGMEVCTRVTLKINAHSLFLRFWECPSLEISRAKALAKFPGSGSRIVRPRRTILLHFWREDF